MRLIDRRVNAAGNGLAVAIAALSALLFLALAGRFAAIQNVWIDESTQLLGSGLPFGRMIAWLAGHPEPLGVPPDRMPPVSYALDALCGRTLCGSVLAFRWLHLLVCAGALVALVLLAARRYGWAAGVVTGAILALAPQMLQTGVEIRAYPLFFAVTVLQLWLLFRLVESAPLSPRLLIAFVATGILAIYTHFFGVVSSSALFSGLIVARVRQGPELLRMGIGWAVVLAAAAGIVPFVRGASALSTAIENPGPPNAHTIVLFFARVIGHSSMMLQPALVALFCVGLGGLLLLAILRIVLPVAAAPRAVAEPALAVLVALVAGLTVTILAGFVVQGFFPMKPSYSIWTVPLVALLAGSACAAPGRGARIVALGAGAITIVALVPLALGFEQRAAWFVHGPERAIAGAVGDRPAGTAIVYTDDNWAYGYFPLIYRYRGALAQYVRGADGALRPIGAGGNIDVAPVPPVQLRRFDRLLLVAIPVTSYRELRDEAAGAPDPDLQQPPVGDLLGPAAGPWHSVNAIIRPGLYWLRLTLLQRNDAR